MQVSSRPLEMMSPFFIAHTMKNPVHHSSFDTPFVDCVPLACASNPPKNSSIGYACPSNPNKGFSSTGVR